MDRMMSEMGKDVEEDERMIDLFERRISSATGPSCELPKKYEGPSDEITSREG